MSSANKAAAIVDQARAGMLVPRAALELAVDMLALVASECAECGGNGWTREIWEVFTLTDDARGGPKVGTLERRARVLQIGPEVDNLVRGAGVLKIPCLECRAIRQVIETAGRSL